MGTIMFVYLLYGCSYYSGSSTVKGLRLSQPSTYPSVYSRGTHCSLGLSCTHSINLIEEYIECTRSKVGGNDFVDLFLIPLDISLHKKATF